MVPYKIVTTPPMHLQLILKKECEFFWLKDIRNVDITQCCAKCFIGPFINGFWGVNWPGAFIEMDIRHNSATLAHYLCGLSKGFVWRLNTHVAFVPDPNSEIHIDNDRIKLDITNARRINFWSYTPNPEGYFTNRQRTCRNWIFANYIKDGMLL